MEEIKSYWENDYSGEKTLVFVTYLQVTSAGDLPEEGTECREYSIRELDDPTGNPPVQTLWHINGLTCAWYVEYPKTEATIELFWLEIHDGFDPGSGQTPLASLDAVVRNVFASARMIKPAPYLDGVKAGLHPGSIDCLVEYREWKVMKGWRAMAVSKPVTTGGSTWQMCSFSAEAPSREIAIEQALTFCRGVQFQGSIKTDCRVTEVAE